MSEAKFSRRKLFEAAVAMPLVGAVANVQSRDLRQALPPDPLVARVKECVETIERVDALSAEADDLQGALFKKARALGIRGDKACKSRMPESKAWRAKKREFDKVCGSLEILASEIQETRATTIAGAIAKIELSLYVQYEDWSEHAFEFISGGIAELRDLTANAEGYR
jgi:hypothetical protein